MDYSYGLSALPKELSEKLSKIKSYQDFAKKDWTEDVLDQLFIDLDKELTKDEKTTFYRSLLQSITNATKNGFEEVVKYMKPSIDSGLTEKARDIFPPGSEASREMGKMGLEVGRITILLCNIFEAQEKNGDVVVDELMEAIFDLAEQGHEKDVFKRIETIYNCCKKIAESPELYPKKPSNNGENNFRP